LLKLNPGKKEHIFYFYDKSYFHAKDFSKKIYSSTNYSKKYFLKTKIDLYIFLISLGLKDILILLKTILLQKILGKLYISEPQETLSGIRNNYYNKSMILL
jgi:hypothetical protein